MYHDGEVLVELVEVTHLAEVPPEHLNYVFIAYGC